MLFAVLAVVRPVAFLTPQPPLPFTPRSSAPVIMGWSDSGWNWGSAIGDAHNEAMRVRNKFSTPSSRTTFLQESSNDDVDIEEAKMLLALSCQRARNVGYDLPNRGWEMLMEEMAACDFEGDGGEDKLADAIRERLPSAIQFPDASPKAMIGVALKRLGFVERGL